MERLGGGFCKVLRHSISEQSDRQSQKFVHLVSKALERYAYPTGVMFS